MLKYRIIPMICERPLSIRVGMGCQEYIHTCDIRFDLCITLEGVGLVLEW